MSNDGDDVRGGGGSACMFIFHRHLDYWVARDT